MNKYDDIINLSHPISKNHKHMSMEERAAQFAPFAALTGYEESVAETARITDNKKELSEALLEILNNKLLIINNHLKENPLITFTYFVPDIKKKGGSYITITGNVKKIDNIKKKVILTNKTIIKIDDILSVTGNLFNEEID